MKEVTRWRGLMGRDVGSMPRRVGMPGGIDAGEEAGEQG